MTQILGVVLPAATRQDDAAPQAAPQVVARRRPGRSARQRAELSGAVSEAEWTNWVIKVAKLHGWRVTHFRPARTEQGWRTALAGHKGFPDLVLARDGNVLIAELKKDNGRLTPDQRLWLAALGEQATVWRPRDRDQVLATLSAPRRGSA